LTSKAPSYKAVLKRHESCCDEVKNYFDLLPKLIEEFPWEVALAYLFLNIEKAQNRMLYCGVVKLHRADSTLADRAVNAQHITRDGFASLFENVFGRRLTKATANQIDAAEGVRDRVIHGKIVSDAEMREAISNLLDYSEAINSEVDSLAGFKPFGDLRGFKGRRQALDASTTRWLLKGLGFNLA
jgi:hypothetical protein